MGWERYTLRSDAIIGVEGFGASAPGPVLMEKYGFTVENVVRRAQALLGED
jgi:transketolase